MNFLAGSRIEPNIRAKILLFWQDVEHLIYIMENGELFPGLPVKLRLSGIGTLSHDAVTESLNRVMSERCLPASQAQELVSAPQLQKVLTE